MSSGGTALLFLEPIAEEICDEGQRSLAGDVMMGVLLGGGGGVGGVGGEKGSDLDERIREAARRLMVMGWPRDEPGQEL